MNKFHPFFALAMILFTACSTEVISDFGTAFCEDFVDGTLRYHNGRYKAQFCDKRDGKEYVYVTIGEQTWMAENLNYRAASSKCYDGEESNCTEYGRLYNWSTAKSVCPSGWHLPNDAEWDALVDYAGGSWEAGKELKTTSGWDSYGNYYNNYEGTDNYGFSALPGGYSYGYFDYVGSRGFWWSADEYYINGDIAYYRYMYYSSNSVNQSYNSKTYLLSVRCVMN